MPKPITAEAVHEARARRIWTVEGVLRNPGLPPEQRAELLAELKSLRDAQSRAWACCRGLRRGVAAE